jgi:tetratricopeptide (TPR) repeat protein
MNKHHIKNIILLLVWMVGFPFAIQAQKKQMQNDKLSERIMAAKVLYADGRFAEAITLLDSVVVVKPLPDAYYTLGLCYQATLDFKKTIPCLMLSLRLDSTSLPTYRALGQCYRTLGLLAEARNIYQRALLLDSVNVAVLNAYAALLYEQEEYAEAVQSYEKLAQMYPENSFLHAQIARCYVKLPERADTPASATLHYSWALRGDSANVPLTIEYAQFLMGKNTRNSLNGALVYLNNVLQYAPNNPAIYKEKGKVYIRLNDYRQSVEAFQRCLALKDSSDFILRELGISYFRLKQFDSAETFLAKANPPESLEPGIIDTRGASFLGIVKRELKKYDEAMLYFDKTAEGLKRGSVAAMYVQMGLTQKLAEKPEKALALYRQAQALDTANADTFYEIATLYDGSLKDKKSAALFFKRFLERATANSATVKFAIKRLQELGEKVPNLPFSHSPVAAKEEVATTTSTIIILHQDSISIHNKENKQNSPSLDTNRKE